MAEVIKLTDKYIDASDVYDVNQSKTQQDINSSVNSSIQSMNSNLSTLNTTADRINMNNVQTCITSNTGYYGFYVDKVYNSGYPEPYGNVIRLGGNGQCELFIAWSGITGATAGMYFRNRRDYPADASWSPWQKVTATQI